MPNIKKRGIYIISLVLIIIILIIAFLIFEGGENFLNNNIQTDDQRNVNLQDDLIDDSGNVINRVGEPCNFRDGSDSQFIKEGDDRERIQIFYENGVKAKEIVYDCTTSSVEGGTKFIDHERFYRENGMLDKVIGYRDCEGLGCVGRYNFLGIDGTRPYDNYQYKEGTKVFEIFFHEEQVAPKGRPYNNQSKKINYYEDGMTVYQEIYYRINSYGGSVEDTIIQYYENGAKYKEVTEADMSSTREATYYHPNGRNRIAETETYRRIDGSIERTKQWFVDGRKEYIETYYDNQGSKTREITRLEGCPYCFVFEGTVRQIYKEDIEFRVNGTISQITSYFMYADGAGSKLVTEYGEHNNILRQSSYNLHTNELLESRNYNIYTDIKDFDKIISKTGITEQQKQNAIKNAGLFMSVCDYISNGLISRFDDQGSIIDRLPGDNFFSVEEGYNWVQCGIFGYFGSLSTNRDNLRTDTSIYDEWYIDDLRSFHYSDDFYKNKIQYFGA